MKRSVTLTFAVGLLVIMGVAAWGIGANRRFFDYDEVYHAHATWQIAQGLRPFHDFQSSHSPLIWYPLAALWTILPDAPTALVPLRLIAALGTLVSVVAMAASIAAVRPELPAAWLALGVLAVAFDRNVLDYGLEFRPDSWSTALLFSAFLLFLTRRPAATTRRYACFGGLASLAIMASPKFVLLPVTFAILDVAAHVRRRDALRGALFGLAMGIAAAFLATLLWLRWAHVDPALAFQMAIRYQWVVVRNSGYGRGLLDSVIAHSGLLTLVVLGIVAWGAHLAQHKWRPTAYEIALLIFLVAQLALVDRPYKQYYAPWFLVAACFVPFLGFHVSKRLPRSEPWCLAIAILFCGWTAWTAWRWYASHDQAREMLGYYETLLRLSPADGPIIAYPPLHPVVRRDVFYGWSRTTDPGGHGTEAVMRALSLPEYSRRFDRPYYREELAARPPVLVVAPVDDNLGYEPVQWAVLQEYLAANRDEYLLVDEGALSPFWIRRDRLDPAVLERLTGGRQ